MEGTRYFLVSDGVCLPAGTGGVYTRPVAAKLEPVWQREHDHRLPVGTDCQGNKLVWFDFVISVLNLLNVKLDVTESYRQATRTTLKSM